MQSGEAGHDKLKKTAEAAYQHLALRATKLPAAKELAGRRLLAASGLTSLYAEIGLDGRVPQDRVVLKEAGTGAVVNAKELERRIKMAEDQMAALESS